MKPLFGALVVLLTCAYLWGCAETSKLPPTPPQYNVAVESEPAGAVIEVNGDYRGRTPCVISLTGITGVPSGRVPCCHGLTVKAIPTRAGDFVQVKRFPSGGDLPKRLYFNMNLGPATPEIDVNIR
jgi:hypothetical protein